ncbi:MAG TPA: RDD family protein [Woeseiaceae bacterium]|nr:RDD family protein [Woeseiaceae bacterium]
MQVANKAGLRRRLAAILYDCLLVFALLMLASIPFVAHHDGGFVPPNGNLGYQLTLLLVIYAFFVGFWVYKGRTLGMQSWGLQIETGNHQRPGFRQASLRFFAAILSWAPAGLGFLWQLWDKDRLTWHDRISNTRLVYYPRNQKSDL